jgi:hypothetical protein
MDFMPYTKEELRSLQKYIDKECGGRGKLYWGLHIRDALKHCNCNPYQLSCYPFDEETDLALFTIEMIQLPLYINDEDPEKIAIAKWRLFQGK